MHRHYLFAALALAFGLAISALWRATPYEERLVSVQLEQLLPEYARELAGEAIDLQALFIDYADDPVLVGKARLALLVHPTMARPVLSLYGGEEDFKAALREHGESVIAPIHYFLHNEVRTLTLMKQAGDTLQAIRAMALRLWHAMRFQSPPPHAPSPPPRDAIELTAIERGWYAVIFAREQGHDFLGQFVVREDGEVRWIQSERFLENANALFLGGIRTLETRSQLDQPIAAQDFGWAAVDVTLGLSVLKVLRMGRAGAGVGRSMSVPQRSIALGRPLLRSSAIATRLSRYGAPVLLGYLLVRYPSLFNSTLGWLAERLDLPVHLVQTLGWGLVLLPLLYLANLLLRPLAFLLASLAGALRWLDHRMSGARPRGRSQRNRM